MAKNTNVEVQRCVGSVTVVGTGNGIGAIDSNPDCSFHTNTLGKIMDLSLLIQY